MASIHICRYNKSIPCWAIVPRRGADLGSRSSCRGAGVVGQISPHPTPTPTDLTPPAAATAANKNKSQIIKIIKIIIK